MLEDQLSEKHRKRRAHKRKIWAVAGVIVAVLVLVGILWFIFRSPFWQIRAVAVHGNATVAAADITDMIRGGIHSMLGTNDILTWPSGALPTSEVALIPQLASVAVSKNYFGHSVDVTVTERQPFAIWCEMPHYAARVDAAGVGNATSTAGDLGNPITNEECFWFDASGTLFEKAYDTEGSALFAVHDYSQAGLGLTQQILPNIFITNFMSILDVVKQSGLTVKEIALKDLNLQEIDVATYEGPDVYFSLRFSAANDLPVLTNLMAKPGFAKLQYVDFRVENRAYYK